MDARVRKAWNDLFVRKGRTALTLAGLVIGFWGLGSVVVARAILAPDLRLNFTRTEPPHVIIRGENLNAVGAAALAALPGVRAAENRPLIGARIQVAPDRWLPLMLFVVEAFDELAVARFEYQDGAFPPPPGTMLIERDGRALVSFMRRVYARVDRDADPQQAGTAAADQPWPLQLPGGRVVAAPISGTVFDPAQAPSRMEQIVYAYIGRETAAEWQPGGITQRLLISLGPDFRDGEPRAAAVSSIRSRLEAGGAQIARVELPPPDEHPHQFQMNSILLLLTVLGVACFVLSAVLVVNLIGSLLTNQIRQIGALKAIGASAGQVAAMYSASMALLGLAAALLALPLAVASGFRLAASMAGMLNFEVLTTALPWWLYAAMIAAGTVFPVLAAWPPVRRWSWVPVRAALDHYGVAERERRASALDRVPLPLPLGLRLGVRNALRRWRRFVLGVLALAVGAVVFLVAMNTRASLLYSASIEERSKRYDLAISFEEPVARDRIASIERLDGVAGFELWTVGRARARTPDGGDLDLPLVAVPAETRSFVPNLTEGDWVAPGSSRVVVSHRLRTHFPDLAVGDALTVTVAGRELTLNVGGLIKLFGPATLYLDAGAYRELVPDPAQRGNAAFVMLEADGPSPFRFNAVLERHLAEAGVGVRAVQISRMAARIIRSHLVMIDAMLGFMALVMLTVSGLGLASSIGTSVVERTREVGVLRAIGATPAAVYRILGTESIFLALVAWLLALAVATPLSRVVIGYFGAGVVEYPFDYAGSTPGIALSLGVLVLLALTATVAPARAATRRPVVAAIAYE